jgi:hypothetical protein
MNGATHTIDAVAERYGLTVAQVVSRCRQSVNSWPHLRPNKHKASTWLFTDADIDAIDERIAQRGPVVDSWGREKRPNRPGGA